ncbi:MAG: substrate-binding domain-containing protein, partial [Lachnospiraceae bacterium]|nr:substrate-binding domain-containing protein [Lachnospiraceae bacterium]
DLPGSGRILFVGEDIRKSGRLAAQMMSKCIRPGEQVLVALGNRKFEGHRMRMLGFRDRMKELGFPEENILIEETFNDYSTTLHVVSEAIRLHPDLRGIYMANLSVTACAEVVRAYGMTDKIHVICHDINDGIKHLMKTGMIDYTIPQDFVRQGREPLLWLTSYLRKKKLPDSGVFAGLQILCCENI